MHTAVLLMLALAGAPGLALAAQTGYIPYYGKNQIRYDNFDWHLPRPNTSRSITTPRSSRTSSASRAMPRAPISTSAPS